MEEDISSSGNLDNKGHGGEVVDIAVFVQQVERFNCMTEPFAFVLFLWDDLRRWRYPVMTVILWLVCNLGCLILTQAAVFTLVSLLVIMIALTCLVQLHTRILDKFLPNTVVEDVSDEPVDEHSALQTVREFKYSLMQMHDFVGKCNDYLRHFYSLLKWDYTLISLKFHAELCFLLLSLVVLPTRWTAFMLTNWFFLGTEEVSLGARDRFYMFLEYTQGKRTLGSVFDFTKRKNLSKESSNGSVTMETDSEEPSPLTDSDKLSDTGQEERSDEEGRGDTVTPGEKPGMVARLMELKRRRKIISNECCFECKTSFSSILKRRYTCQHCGNNFCSKCCHQKVSKSLLGATAPSAQTEMVPVCVICYKLLQEEHVSKQKTS